VARLFLIRRAFEETNYDRHDRDEMLTVQVSDGNATEDLRKALGTRYQVVRELGRGGAGIVYLGRDTLLHRTVAIKALRPKLATIAQHRDRMIREARLTGQLQHPGLMPVFDIMVTERIVAFVMPYVATSVRRMVATQGPASVESTRTILLDLAAVLGHVHRGGVVHRDVKPDNVLLAEEHGERRTLLADFGAASVPMADYGPNGPPGPEGTPSFMSPEQALHPSTVDHRSDLYALGIVGYFMLAGTVPFRSPDVRAVIAQQCAEKYSPLADRRSDVPVNLVRAIDRCLRADPDARWASTDEFSRAVKSPVRAARPWRRIAAVAALALRHVVIANHS
jgi:serine/threonine-protein kinase